MNAQWLFAQSRPNPNPLPELLKKHWPQTGTVMQAAQNYELQIIYTQIDRDSLNHPHFQTYELFANDSLYYYPASTVKMPAAFLALEKLNQLHIRDLDRDSRLAFRATRPPQTEVEVDSSAPQGYPSIGHYIKKIFLVSDNDAFNRLYEFLGQAELNRRLHDKGYRHCRIIHRLGGEGAAFGLEDNQFTNPVTAYRGESRLYFQGEVHSIADYDFVLQNEQKGVAYLRQGERIEKPFDFSRKNYCALRNLHDILQAVIFPEAVPPGRRFDLTPEDYGWLYRWLSGRPRASGVPAYAELPDGYVKFFMYGGATERIPESIHMFNKVGFAYGYLTDVAYIIDTATGVEFMLAATIHVNANKTYNDNVYEYDSIGLPFLRDLGQIIYEHELTRKRAFRPDFSKFLGN